MSPLYILIIASILPLLGIGQNAEFLNGDLNKTTLKGGYFISFTEDDQLQYLYLSKDNKTIKELSSTSRGLPRKNLGYVGEKNGSNPANNNPLIGMYLYGKEQLTGDSILNVRSVNKFEQMWIQYFINLKLSRRDNPKSYTKEFFEYSISGDLNFNYALSGDQSIFTARLRILAM